MTTEEKIFLGELMQLTDDKLMAWTRGFYTGNNYLPVAPFYSLSDPMDVLIKTLGLLNEPLDQKGYYPLLSRFENILVLLFGREANHPFSHPGVLFKFIVIFTNCPLKGEAVEKLSRTIIPIISQKRWIDIRVGSRVLHYEMLALLVRLHHDSEKEFLNHISVDNFLISNLLIDRSARFCNISLKYFAETLNIKCFFEAFDMSFNILPPDNINSILNTLFIFHKKNDSLSFSYFGEWLSSKILLNKDEREKTDIVFKYEKLFTLILNKAQDNIKEYLSINRKEGSYLFAIIILKYSRYDSSKLSPFFVKVFFENELYNSNQVLLINYLKRLTSGSFYEIRSMLVINNFRKPDYIKCHIATIVSLIMMVNNQGDNFELLDDLNFFIDLEEDPLYRFSIENLNGDTLNATYRLDEACKIKIEIPVNDVPATFEWWQVIEQLVEDVTKFSI